MISVLAYNIHFGRKLNLIEKWLLKDPTRFDVICLQEFPYSDDSKLLLELRKHGFEFKFAPSSYLTKPLRSKQPFGELTLYRKSKVKLTDHKIVKLGANFLEKRFRRGGEKTSLLTVFRYKNKKVAMANSQLVCYAPNSRRINQLAKIIKNIKKIGNHSNFSAVILGDFNYTSRIRQRKLIEFMSENELANAYKAHTHKYFFIPQQVDYVFYNGCLVESVKINKKVKYSDHSPVSFEIDFEK
jgi:endonuclease/exonuclease/phosphatase family metal-dependent hydrolase